MVIVLTGAADGLGREIATQLKGNELILIDCAEEKLKEVAKATKAKFFVCDLTKPENIEKTCREILISNGKIDVLINCAGVWLDEANETNLARYKNMILVNLFGPIAMTKLLLPRFRQQGSGLIININSQAGVECEETSPVYGATKSGLVAFRKNMKCDLNKNGIKITDVSPGFIDTKIFEKAGISIPDETFKMYSLEKSKVASIVKFIITQPADVYIPSLEIKNVHELLDLN
jgi:short-subunit dehydrogenase